MDKEKISSFRCFTGIILSVVILIISQLISLSVGDVLLELSVPKVVCNIISSMLYLLFTVSLVKILLDKFLKMTFKDVRFSIENIRLKYILIALLMPATVIITYIILGAEFSGNNFTLSEKIIYIVSSVFYYGVSVGIVEELIFRGIMLSCLERRFNITVAVTVPSFIFGILHIIGRNLDFISIVQLIAAGSLVGILFSIVSYKSDSIFNSAIMHGLWNILIIGGIFNINAYIDKNALYNLIINSRSFLITGGDFGVEASIVSIAAYGLCILICLLFKKKQ